MKPEVKDYAYYSDVYDRGTVNHARFLAYRDENDIKKRLSEIKDFKKQKEFLRVNIAMTDVIVYFYTGDRYIEKQKTIDEWIEEDKKQLEFYESINKPKDGTYCHQCHAEMKIIDKDIRSDIDNKSDRVLFMLECYECQIRRAVYDNGEEWIAPSEYCKKCKDLNDSKHTRKGDILTTILTCTVCGNIEKDTYELNKPIHKEKPDPNYIKDRKKYCLSEKDGQEYIKAKANIESLERVVEHIKEREDNKEVYDKVAKIKKLKVAELKDLLIKKLAKQDYTSLQFAQPKMERYVTISFTTEDIQSDREEYDSNNQLKRLINKILKNTNWRLMSDGISCRLGVLSGKLKGYESEEDLLKLVK